MKKSKPNFYTKEFKWQVVQEVLSGKITKEEARRIYGIKSNCAVLYWIRKFSGNDNYRIGGQPIGKLPELDKMKELSEKDKHIKQLEQELEREKCRADLWQKMIEIAETELKVDIRKKFGAKQSTPSKNKKKEE
jgi:transposase